MAQTFSLGKNRLELDGDWGLYDFSTFGREYSQAYALLYALMAESDEDEDQFEIGRRRHTFGAYPWRGGFSAVNFYQSLQAQIPKRQRPQIESIRYESPGWIELSLVIAVGVAIRRGIKAVCESVNDINSTYGQIQKGMQERELTQISIKQQELALRRDQLKFASDSFETLANLMKLENELRQKLRELSPNDLAALKILLSLYRRIRSLAKLERDGKIQF